MVRPNPRYGDPSAPTIINDLTKLQRNLENAEKLADRQWGNQPYGSQGGAANPSLVPLPSWWHGLPFHDNDYTIEQAVEYLQVSEKIIQAKRAIMSYRCFTLGSTRDCQNLGHEGSGILSRIRENIKFLQAQIIGLKAGSTAQNWQVKSDNGGFEFLPTASAEEEPSIMEPEHVTMPTLSPQLLQIINDINNNIIQVPNWFRNNIDWVQSGHINEQEFLTAYNNLVKREIIHTPITDAPITEPTVNDLITDNMITQKIDYFTIQNGRAIGQITFTATQNFNPFYYNKTITNIIQFKDRNGVNILPTVKQNNLRFTATERDETIQYDEGMNDNIFAIGSSFVWSSATAPTPFSKQLEFEIREAEPVKPISSGFMAAGVAGAIAGLVLLGFIVDSKVGK